MTPTVRTFRRLVIHHSAGPRSQTTEQIRDYHRRVRLWSDIGYHYTIEADGVLRVGRPMPAMGAHAKDINAESIGICVVGDNTDPEQSWNAQQAETLRRFVAAVRWLFPWIDVVGHGQAPGQSTACPGVSPEVLRAILGDASWVQG